MAKLHSAIIKNDIAAVKRLLAPRWWRGGADINQADPDRGEETPLQIASNIGIPEIVQLLLDNGADINRPDTLGNTALHACCMDGSYGINLEVAKLLLANGAKLDSAESAGWTPLHFAANGGHPDLVRLLLSAGADASAKSHEGDTPLHVAAFGAARHDKRPKVAELLIDAGANVNAAENTREMTPLHYAADRGFAELAKLLIDRGANVNGANKTGDTPLTLAKVKAALTDVLLRRSASIRDDAAVIRDYGTLTPHRDIVACFVQHDAIEGHSITKDQLAELLHAAENGEVDELTRIVNEGVCVNYVNDSGQTALHLAAKCRNPKCCQLLLAHGAEPNSPDADGKTPLHYAVKRAHMDHIECCRALLQNGADPNALDAAGMSPMAESLTGEREILKLLPDNMRDFCAGTLKQQLQPLVEMFETYGGVVPADLAVPLGLKLRSRTRKTR